MSILSKSLSLIIITCLRCIARRHGKDKNHFYLIQTLFMKNLFIIISSVMLLVGCTPQRRLQRLMEHHPELITATDTLILSDTILRPGESVERIIHLSVPCPDLIAEATNNSTQLATTGARTEISVIDSTTLRWRLMQLPDTVYVNRTVKVPRYKVEMVDKPLSPVKNFILAVGYTTIIMMVLIVVFYMFNKFKKII